MDRYKVIAGCCPGNNDVKVHDSGAIVTQADLNDSVGELVQRGYIELIKEEVAPEPEEEEEEPVGDPEPEEKTEEPSEEKPEVKTEEPAAEPLKEEVKTETPSVEVKVDSSDDEGNQIDLGDKTRNEIMARLTEMGVTFHPNSSKTTLFKLYEKNKNKKG
jgi:hypothetical protein